MIEKIMKILHSMFSDKEWDADVTKNRWIPSCSVWCNWLLLRSSRLEYYVAHRNRSYDKWKIQ